jgi:OOP family OmpA-OmpF porin
VRRSVKACLLSAAVFTPIAVHGAEAPPSVEQIAQALDRPAASRAPAAAAIRTNPLQVTAAMLKGPTRGIVPAQPSLRAAVSQVAVSQTAVSQVAVSQTAVSQTAVSQAAVSQTATTAGSGADATDPACPKGSGACALNVEFETASADLTAGAVAAVNNLGKALATLQASGFRFRIEGHTDTVGGNDYNRALSAQRADTVTTYLSEHFAIDRAHLEPVGMGKEHPLVATPDQTSEPRNRRVRVVNLGA